MAEPRLIARLRVQALLRAADAQGLFAVRRHKGDEIRGGILLIIARDGGYQAMELATALDGGMEWRAAGDTMAETDAEALIAKRRRFDRDLWVVEIEDRDGGFSPPL